MIAYSTCSQLGYMFFACGVSAYGAAIFHLMTHAFFKALLFLGAGSVIHAMSNEQDMRKMGGIWRKIPITYAMMWIGSLALAGLPVFAGYYSKDIILESAFADHSLQGNIAFWLGIAAAIMTAFYSWRLLFMTFHGKPRASKKVMSHVHESPAIMLAPLGILVLGALFSGIVGYYAFHMVSGDGAFWNGAILVLDHNNTLKAAHHVPSWVKLLPIVVALAGIGLAWWCYIHRPKLPAMIAAKFGFLYRFLLNKWYFDELYHFVFIRGAKALGLFFWRVLDVRVVDGLGPNGAAKLTQKLGGVASRLQTGYVYHYAFALMLGLVAVMSWLVYTLLEGVAL